MKKALIIIFIIAFIIEAALTFLCFFMPVKTFELFGMPYNEAYAFLGYLTAWFLLLVTSLIGFVIYSLINNKDCQGLIYILGFWWILLGIAIYFKFGKNENLFLDSAKGLIIVGLNYFLSYKKEHKSLHLY
jgi:hypothetical protein